MNGRDRFRSGAHNCDRIWRDRSVLSLESQLCFVPERDPASRPASPIRRAGVHGRSLPTAAREPLPDASEVVLEPFDVVLAEVVPVLYFDEDERLLADVRDAMCGSPWDVDR